VIAEVRGRVASFERRIEAYRQQLLGGGGPRVARMAVAGFVVLKPWLLYASSNGWMFLTPPADDQDQWLTPTLSRIPTLAPIETRDGQPAPVFDGHVKRIIISGPGTGGTVQKLRELYTPWDTAHTSTDPQQDTNNIVELRKNPALYGQLADELEEVETIMTETVERPGMTLKAPTPLSDFRPVADPRYASVGREYWTDEDRIRLPDYALPIRLRSVDDLLSSASGSNAPETEYLQLVDYLYWRTRAARVQRHRAGDRDDSEQITHNRGSVNQLLLDQLGLAEADPVNFRSAWVGGFLKTQTDPDWFGMVFQLAGFDPAHLADYTFQIVRISADGHETTTPIQARMPTDPATVDKVRKHFTLLPARQQFDVLQQGANGSTKDELAQITVKLPIALDPKFLQEDLETFSHFRVHRRFPWQQDPEVVGDQVRPELVYVDEDVPLGQAPVVVVGPFIFTDVFGVKARVLSTPGLIAESTEFDYFLEMVTVGDLSSAPDYRNNLKLWPRVRVRLHVPLLNTFPTDLGIVMPFDSLVALPTTAFASFALISGGKEGTPLATVPKDDGTSRLLASDDFELWAEPIPLQRSGFYAGVAETTDASNGASKDPVLDDFAAESPSSGARTTDGLFQVMVESDPQNPGWFRPTAVMTAPTSRLLAAGFGFRLYLRPMIRPADAGAAPAAIGPVRPLPMFLSRTVPPVDTASVPPQWQQAPRLRPVQLLEWIPADLYKNFGTQPPTWTPIAICERPLDRNVLRYGPDLTRRHLGFSWTLANPGQGGVEILIRDVDDTALQARLLCESVADPIYETRIPDFRNASLWQLTRLEQSARLAWPDETEAAPTTAPADLAARFLFLDSSNPVIAGLQRQSVELGQRLGDKTTNWRDLLVAGKNWMTAVYAFQKSPINLNDAPVRETIANIELTLRCLLTGRTDPGIQDQMNPDTRKLITDATTSLLTQIENTDASQLQLSDDTDVDRDNSRRMLVDLDLAKRLAAIARSREVVAEELFDSSNEPPPVFSGDDPAASWLPRGQRFEELRQQYGKLAIGGPMPLTGSLLSLYATSAADKITSANATAVLADEVQRLIKLATFDPTVDAAARRTAAAGIVSKAAGLTKAFNRLDALLSTVQSQGDRRPHHQVTIKSTSDDQKTPQATPLESLMPDEVKADDSSAEQSAPPAREVMAYWNLLEHMGFALDVGAYDSLGSPFSQAELLATIDSAHLEDLIPAQNPSDAHVVQIIVGREPDSEYRGEFPDPTDNTSVGGDYVGHAFVKIAVIPKTFHDLLASRSSVDQLKQWFNLRNVTLDGDDAKTQALLDRVGRTASYVKFKMPPGQVARVRVEVRDRRWVSLPAVNGGSHVDWPVPDARGHRFEAVARAVSRYEPVIRWRLNQYAPVDWPDAVPGVVPAEIAARRLVTEDLQLSDFVADIPENLPVCLYGHPELIRFSYLLPSAAARSLLNVISAVRTGYQGVTTIFRYELRDHDALPQRWDSLLREMMLSSGQVHDPPTIIKPAPQNVLVDARLMRNERMLTLRNLPYFYQYRLHARAQYEADFVRPAVALPPEGDHPARREPKILAIRPPTIKLLASDATSADFQIDVWLTRTADLLTPAEWAASPPLEPYSVVVNTSSGTTTVSLSPDQLPEPSMGYHFYYQVSNSDVYVFVAELLMPWHPAYKLPPNNQPLRPWFRLMDSRVTYGAGTEWPEIQLGQSDQGTAGMLDQPAYVVTVKFHVTKSAHESEILFTDPTRQGMQASRAGKLSELVLPE